MGSGSRETLVQTMVEIIAAQGFEGLSVRGVATRARVSIGAVQHHFPTKNEMLNAAMTAITSLAARQSAELANIADPSVRLHRLVDGLIPHDENDQVARVWLAFTSRAAVDENIRAAYVHLWTRLRVELRLLLAAASGRPDDADTAATELMALLDGFTIGIIAEKQDSQTARRVAHARLDELLKT